MTSSKNHIFLSHEMQELKENIEKQMHENKTLLDQIHRKSSTAELIISGISNAFSVLAGFLSNYKEVPVIGGIIQFASIIAKSISILTDTRKSRTEKIMSSALVVTVLGLSITAIVLGAIAALIIGIVATAIMVVLEGLGFLNQIINKFKTAKTYVAKKEFNELIKQGIIEPFFEKYHEQLAIRAIELDYEISRPALPKSERNNLIEELEYINRILKDNCSTIETDMSKSPYKLNQLYQQRTVQIKELEENVALMASTPSSPDTIAEKIRTLQNDIVTTENDISKITLPIDVLKKKNVLESEKLMLSYTNIAIASAATIFSVIGLLLALGTIAAPPIMLSIIGGIGIGMAVIGLIKWAAERIAALMDAKEECRKVTEQKELILEEALNGYYISQNPGANLVGASSHSSHMHVILTSAPEKVPGDILRPNSKPEAAAGRDITQPAMDHETPIAQSALAC